MTNEFRFRTAASAADALKLKAHFSEVFFEGVGVLVENQFHRFPRMKNRYWFIAEWKETGEIVSSFYLTPWVWEIEGARLKVAQMTGAATLSEYRQKGLIRELFKRFVKTVAEEEFDLVVIGGIGGFWRQFGFCYALPFENHINLNLDLIPERSPEDTYSFRLAEESDIQFLMAHDEPYRKRFSISTFRDDADWQYLLNDRFHTIFGSEFWLMEHKENGTRFYCRIPQQSHFGGSGLLVSEISEDIHEKALIDLFAFCKQKAIEGQKPFIRFNLHDDTRAVKAAKALGAEQRGPYAWQIRIPDPARFLWRIAPVLEDRLRESDLEGFTGTFRLDFFKTKLDLIWEGGKLATLRPGEGNQDHILRVHAQLFPILCLGYRSWSELKYIWPDIGPNSERSKLWVETLFPVTRSWLYEPA